MSAGFHTTARPSGDGGLEERSNLTRSQVLIWAGQALAPDAPIYNMGWRFDLHAPLNPVAFEKAFDAVCARFDALRTVVDLADGAPRQRVQTAPAGRLTVLETPPEDVDAFLEREVRTPFDLAQASFRAALIRLSADHWVWSFIQHHLLTDAASGALLFDALSTAYAAEIAPNDDAAATPAAAAESFHAQAQAQAQDAAARQDAHAFWTRRVAELEPPPKLFARPPQPLDTRTHLQLVSFGEARAARLRALAATAGFSALSPAQAIFNIIATAAFAWIARVSSARAVSLGIPAHGRATLAARRTPGLFVELYPLGVTLSETERFRALHAQVVERAADLFKHAAPGASTAEGHARFNVVLNLIPTRFGPFAGAPADVTWLDQGRCDPNHALWIDVIDFAGTGALSLRMRFNQSVFDAASAERAPRQLLRLLDALLDDPDDLVDAVPLAEPDEASSALIRRGAEIQAEASAHPVEDVLVASQRWLAEDPDAVAVEGDGGSLSRAQLNRRAEQAAAALRAQGVAAGDLIGVHMRRSPDLIAGILGVLKLGAAYAPLDPLQPPGRLDAIADAAALRVTLADDDPETEEPGAWRGGGARIRIDDAPSAGDAARDALEPSADALAYVLYTSGSTGVPKGVAVERRALARYAAWAHREFAHGRAATWSLHSATGFDLTVTSIFAPLISGGVIRVYREPFEGPDLSILRVFDEDAVDVVKLTPAHLALALAGTPRPMARIQTLILGGEDLSVALARRAQDAFGRRLALYNEYGPTEAVVGCMSHRFDRERDVDASVPIGRPAAATAIYVLSSAGAPAPDDVVGALHVAGPDRLAAGYFRSPEATDAAFPEDPFRPNARMYRTGDLASVRPDGVLRYHGRADAQMKRRGFRIEPAEIRQAVVAHPQVSDCVLTVMEGADAPARAVRRCVVCGLGEDHPEADLDADGRCAPCRDFDGLRARAAAYFRTLDDLRGVMDAAAPRRTGAYDAIMLLSGGKDSTYALCRLAEITPNILAATLDNGFISDGAKANIQRVCETLNVEHRFMTTPHMNEVFVDSLERHADVCNGCFKAIFILALQLAREVGAPILATGLSRGQLFETRLAPAFAADPDVSSEEIDASVMAARKAYHRFLDAPARRLNGDLFEDDRIFSDVELVDFYRYCDVSVDEVYAYLTTKIGWLRPEDTGRSTNCLINDLGIATHRRRRGHHNYAMPYSWDVRLGHKTRAGALEELDDEIDADRNARILEEIGAPARWGRREERLVCHYVTAGDEPSPRALRRFLAERLPREAIPDALTPLARLPLTPNGKVDQNALPAPDPAALAPSLGSVAARTLTESALLTIWREVLERPAFGVEDNFFEHGGDSIHAIVIATRIAREGLSASAADILQLQTVAAVAARLDAAQTSPTPAAPETDPPKPRAALDEKSRARLAAIFGTKDDA